MNLCREHGCCFPCPECERIRVFSLRALSISTALAMMVLVIVLWAYHVVEPASLRAIVSVEALIFLGLMWTHYRADQR